MAPVIGGNVFNLLFGRVYDSNTVCFSCASRIPFQIADTRRNQVGRIGAPAGMADRGELLRSLVKRAGGISPDSGHDCEHQFISVFVQHLRI